MQIDNTRNNYCYIWFIQQFSNKSLNWTDATLWCIHSTMSERKVIHFAPLLHEENEKKVQKQQW